MQKLFFTGLALFGLFRVIAQGPDTTSPYKLKTIKIEEINEELELLTYFNKSCLQPVSSGRK